MRKHWALAPIIVATLAAPATLRAQAPDSQPAAAPAAAQAAPGAGDIAASVQAVKQQAKMIVYPAKQQTPEVQAKDESECYLWSQEQTGIDPMAAGPDADSAAQVSADKMDSAATGAAVAGAAKGAVGGAVVGGIVGDAGTGAALGAVGGAVRGRKAKKAAEAQAAQQGAAHANAISADRLATFTKGFAACLQGRGYTVQ